jgi:hypothetical protein
VIRARLERREETPLYLQVAIPLAAVAAALLICSGLVWLSGTNVVEAYRLLLFSTFQSRYDIQDTLVKAAPLLFTGLAVLVAFRAKFWNIGAEGQLMAGAIAACFVGQREWLPAVSLVPLMIVGAAIFGAAWALLPALLKVRLKVDDVVTTLLLNFIMLYGVTALLEGPWRDPASGYPNAPSIRYEAEFPGDHRGADLGCAGRPRRRRRGGRRALPGDLRPLLRLRLCRDRGRHARRAEPARRGSRGAVLRHHLQRRRVDGARDRRPGLSRRGDPGRRAGLHGGGTAVRDLPAAGDGGGGGGAGGGGGGSS